MDLLLKMEAVVTAEGKLGGYLEMTIWLHNVFGIRTYFREDEQKDEKSSRHGKECLKLWNGMQITTLRPGYGWHLSRENQLKNLRKARGKLETRKRKRKSAVDIMARRCFEAEEIEHCSVPATNSGTFLLLEWSFPVQTGQANLWELNEKKAQLVHSKNQSEIDLGLCTTKVWSVRLVCWWKKKLLMMSMKMKEMMINILFTFYRQGHFKYTGM